MSVSCCYWALLGLEEFDYLYVSDYLSSFILPCGRSPHELLIYQSLFQFIHPDEMEAAKLDLESFIKIRSLAGAVTRCRLKNVNKYNKDEEPWIVTDIIMYTATTNTILTFFHSHVNEKYSANDIPCCGNGNIYSFEASCIQHILNDSTLPPIMPFQNQHHHHQPFRIFQIHDTNTHELVLSWPPAYVTPTANDSATSHESFVRLTFDLVQNITLRMMEKRLSDIDSKNMVCAHHSHSNSTVLMDSYGTCEVERIVITYGSLTFSTFQVTPSSDATVASNLTEPLSSAIANTTNLVGSPTMDIPKTWKTRFGAYEKKCEKCQTSSSPEWRKGPSGHKTYCNACGLRYARQIAKQQNDDRPENAEV